jgi:hypothetical protein
VLGKHSREKQVWIQLKFCEKRKVGIAGESGFSDATAFLPKPARTVVCQKTAT